MYGRLIRSCRAALALGTAVLICLAQAGAETTVDAPAAGSGRWGRDYFPNTVVFTQEGKPVRFYDDLIAGKMVVVSFIYTSCPDICPLVTARLAEVQDRLAEAKRDFHFISISVDPARDTPDALKRYAEAFRIKENWTLITGRPDEVKAIGRKLGERGRRLTEHQNDIVLGNDVTGEWARDSAFTDINALALTIRSMDPRWRAQVRSLNTASAPRGDGNKPGQELFAKACAVCHTVGKGDKVGPDLIDITSRRSKAWLAGFISSPSRMRAAQDPTALELAARYPSVRMPNIGLAEHDAGDLIAYIEAMTYAAKGTATGQTTPPAGAVGHAHH